MLINNKRYGLKSLIVNLMHRFIENGDIMVIMLTSSAANRGFEPRSGQTKRQ
jgi:hypothetical protein